MGDTPAILKPVKSAGNVVIDQLKNIKDFTKAGLEETSTTIETARKKGIIEAYKRAIDHFFGDYSKEIKESNDSVAKPASFDERIKELVKDNLKEDKALGKMVLAASHPCFKNPALLESDYYKDKKGEPGWSHRTITDSNLNKIDIYEIRTKLKDGTQVYQKLTDAKRADTRDLFIKIENKSKNQYIAQSIHVEKGETTIDGYSPYFQQGK